MATHLITYDLHEPGQNYDKLIAAIKRYPGWCKVAYSAWLITTSDSPSTVRDVLRREIDANDKLFVVDVTGKAAAWSGLSSKVGDWIKKNL